MESYSCTFCSKSFTINKNLLRHIKNVHENDTVKSFKCDTCSYSTNRSDTLKKHKIVHSANAKKVPSVYCSMCEYKCYNRSDMLLHYQSEHEIQIPKAESFQFSSIEKFDEWKVNIEKTEKCSFVKNRGNDLLVDGTTKVTYACFRDGYHKSKGKNIRHEKVLGTNKINGYCPAKMDVFINPSKGIRVDFLKTHVGHKNDLGRLKLSQQEKEDLAKNIALGIPFDKILDTIRSSVTNDEVERRYLVTRKDLKNIARDYNLAAEGVSHHNDSTSVHSWVEEMQQSGNSIVFYKPQGEISDQFPQLKEDDFVLIIMNDVQNELLQRFGEKCICLDSTHGMNSYGFELTTLLVLDNSCQGFPCSFMFSNRTDTEMLEFFF